MKKKILGAAIVAAIALVSGMNISQSKNEAALTDVALMNVEALADESGCHYINGFQQFKNGNGHAYDCCTVWRSGLGEGVCL
jgi:hypothetical protein